MLGLGLEQSLVLGSSRSFITCDLQSTCADEEHSDNHIRVAVGNIQMIRLGLLWELEGHMCAGVRVQQCGVGDSCLS